MQKKKNSGNKKREILSCKDEDLQRSKKSTPRERKLTGPTSGTSKHVYM